MLNNIQFKAVVDGKERDLLVMRPTFAQQREGQKVYNTAFNEAVRSGAMIRQELEDFMKKRDIWNEEKSIKLLELYRKIADNENVLEKGGVKLTKALEVAKELKFKLRDELRSLLAERYSLDSHTAESQADDARFNYWASVCLVYNDTKKPVFKDIDDYFAKSDQEYAVQGARKLMKLIYELEEDAESSLVENKFLREFKFADEKNRLVNKEGKLVDEYGNLIDENGYLVVEPVSRQPFLDDEDKPITELKVLAEENKEQVPQEQLAANAA